MVNEPLYALRKKKFFLADLQASDELIPSIIGHCQIDGLFTWFVSKVSVLIFLCTNW